MGTVPGFGFAVLEGRQENSLPLTEIAVAAAWAVWPPCAEATPAGVSAAMPAATTMSLFMAFSFSWLQFAVVPWSAPGALLSSARRRLFALRRGVYGWTSWPVEPFCADAYASLTTAVVQRPARRGSGGGADCEPS